MGGTGYETLLFSSSQFTLTMPEGFDVLFPQNSLRREYFGLHQDAKSCSRLRGCGDRVHLIAVDYGFAWTFPYI